MRYFRGKAGKSEGENVSQLHRCYGVEQGNADRSDNYLRIQGGLCKKLTGV